MAETTDLYTNRSVAETQDQELLENTQVPIEKYSLLQQELETAYQSLHDCKRQLKTAEALEKEYQFEIESLSIELNNKEKVFAVKISQIEEDSANSRSTLIERIQILESDLLNKDRRIEELQNELEIAKRCELTKEGPDEEKLLADIAKQNEEIALLTETIDKLKESIEGFQNSNNIQLEKINILETECARLNEAFDLKKEELIEAKELSQNLQDEIMCLKSELETLKSKPLEEKSKGNSLFSEVDDRRVQLQSTVNMMKAKYNEVKRERAEHLKLIEHLRNENAILCKRWEAEIEEKYNDQEMTEESLRLRIKSLEDLLEKYKKDLNNKPLQLSGFSCGEMKFFDGLLDTKRKEIEELREKIADLSLSHTLLTRELTETKKEVRRWKLKVTQQDNEISKLKADLYEVTSEKKLEDFEKFTHKLSNNEGNRQSNITTRKKSSTSSQFSLKSCLKSRSMNTNDAQLENDEKTTVTVSHSCLTEKDMNLVEHETKEEVSDNDCVFVSCEQRKVQFSENTSDNIHKSKPKPPMRKILTNSKITYKTPVTAKVVSNKENDTE